MFLQMFSGTFPASLLCWLIYYFATYIIIWFLVMCCLEALQSLTFKLKSGALTTSSTLSETHKSGFSGAKFPQRLLGLLGSFCLGRSRGGQCCHVVCFGTLIPVPLGVWWYIFCFEVLPQWCSCYEVLHLVTLIWDISHYQQCVSLCVECRHVHMFCKYLCV